MADLDNFFAKKDKKKVKGRKYDNPDEIAKRLKESEKKLEKELCKVEPVKKSLDEVLSTTSKSSAGSESITQEPKVEKQQEEEEWKDFTDEAQKDLTNLKISKLQIEDEEDNMLGYGSGDEDGNSGAGNKADGVWNRNIPVVEQEIISEPDAAAVPSGKDDSKSLPGGKNYVPPHMRNVQQSSPHKGSRKPKTAPDITNAMAFPSLSDAQNPNPGGPWGRKKIGDDRGFRRC
ncbi:hypothetical protein Anas_06059 [Armadillidium nasatum]|uniref:Protein CDV3-like protein n=1 Tax=Armadillidium nasatum TaxID=96803 RepID=A0A5N5TMM5_9CRUS|nr:hypothetical protein Anas_06059 [Armadillidium nasatum]